MKNLIIGVLLIGVIVTGYIAANAKLKMSLEGLEGKTERIIVGDLTRLVTATGEVRPARRVEIKSKASGEVIRIARQPGDRVEVGDLLIELEKEDEQRSVDKARLDVKSARARLEDARINLQRARGSDLTIAKARVDRLNEQLRLIKYRWDKISSLDAAQTSEEERLQHETTYRGLLADVAEAEAGVERAGLAIPSAEQAVAQHEAALERAEAALADAEKLLSETDIIAPINGIVGNISAEVGDVIQGGKTTFTGGTVLATVLDMDLMIVGAEVDESDIERVRSFAPAWAIPGHVASAAMPEDLKAAAQAMEHLPVITVESFRDQEFEGVIERIYPEPRTISGVVTYLVDVVISSENRSLLLPGMRADVRFTSEHLENVRLCPNEAIREGPNGQLGVHVPRRATADSEEASQFVACKFGLNNGNYSEVLCDELREGTTVYTKLPMKRE